MGTGSFPDVESERGVTLTPHPLLVPRSKNRVELYLYSPFAAYKKGETYLHISASLSIKTAGVCQVTLVETMKLYGGILTFRGPCIVIHSYNESQRDELFFRFI